MYPKSKFLEMLHHIRQQMAREGDYDIGRFLQMACRGPVCEVREVEADIVRTSPARKPSPARSKKARKVPKQP